MKLELRTREYYESAFQFAPKLECVIQNQKFMFEMLLAIIDRLNWRAKIEPKSMPLEIKDGEIKSAPKPIVPVGESGFKKEVEKITKGTKEDFDEEPL